MHLIQVCKHLWNVSQRLSVSLCWKRSSLNDGLQDISGFFCWRLLGLIPGGTPFSQLNKGVRDAMSISTKRCRSRCIIAPLDESRVTIKQKHAKAVETNNNKGTKGKNNHPRRVPRLQRRAPVMSERQPLCRRRTGIERRWLW